MLKSFAAYAAVAAVAIIASASIAQTQDEPAYLDDRSTPQRLVLSYYNAVNRHEYARAYSYYGAEDAPAYDAWQVQYDRAVRAEVTFGDMAQEGAAGSTYYSLPVTVDIETAEGRHDISKGCFQIRLVQPANQTPPFQPMSIMSNDLGGHGKAGFAPAKCD